jgi:hypothetical protein
MTRPSSPGPDATASGTPLILRAQDVNAICDFRKTQHMVPASFGEASPGDVLWVQERYATVVAALEGTMHTL